MPNYTSTYTGAEIDSSVADFKSLQAEGGSVSANDLQTALANYIKTSDITSILLNKIYPVGSIYLSISSTNPSTFLGGTWTQIAQGRTLFGAGSLNSITYTAGETKDAGLPNLSGSMGLAYCDYNAGNTSYDSFVSGPFYYIERNAMSQNMSAGSNDAQR